MLDDFTSGDRELQSKLNELLAVVRKVERISGDEHIKVRHTAGGINISMERIPKGSGGGSTVRWYKLSAVAANPMTGKEQTCSEGSFSDTSGAENVSIYRYPQFTNQTSYEVDDVIAAITIGDSIVSLYNTPHEIYECT